jgi:hypothetical protein
MTAQRLILPLCSGRRAVQSFHFTDFHVRVLLGRPHGHERRRAH